MTANLVTASSLWAIASAIGVAFLGALSLRGGRLRPRGAVAFGFFAILWGIQIVVANVGVFAATPTSAGLLDLANLVLLLPLPYLLLEFAAAQGEGAFARRWPAIRGWTLGFTGGVLLLFAVVPRAFFEGVVSGGKYFVPSWGPLYGPLVVLPFYGAFGISLVVLAQAFLSAPTARTARRVQTLLIGLGIFLGSTAGKLSVIYAGHLAGATATVEDVYFLGIFLVLAAFVLWSIRAAARAMWSARTERDRSQSRTVFLSLTASLALGVGEGIVNLVFTEDLYTAGLWRLIGVGVVVYGFATLKSYDLRDRASRTAATASGLGLAGVGGAAAYGVAAAIAEGAVFPAVAAIVVMSFAVVPSIRLARRLFGAPSSSSPSTDDAVYGQRIDAYRAALEASYARGSLDEDAEFLAALRERFGISDAEDRVLRHYAKSSVIVARDRKASEAFERLRLLGEGGGGRTWLARDRQRDRLVVLKEPLQQWQQDPQTREAVLREARLAARVRHPNVVAVEEVVEGKGSPIIVMEYLEGGSMSDLLRARGTLPWREAVPLVIDIARGVEAVHAAGIVHRDIKPSNILLNGEGVPKVADFGIALPTTSTRTILDVGATARAGTLFYMAPEVRAGMSAGDRRADVYACAAVLHECLYGAPPGANAPVILRSDVPAALTAILARALAERPEDRMPTARVLAEELSRVLRT